MSFTVWLCANTLTYPEGGGHAWAYLNWALGFKSIGCEVVWVEPFDPAELPANEARALVASLKVRLKPYGMAEAVALCSSKHVELPPGFGDGCVDLEAASSADLLVNMAYDACEPLIPRFRRSALIDIDPGLLQVWLAAGAMRVPPHDVYFSTGEALVNDCDRNWLRVPPCVSLDWWPVSPAPPGAPFSTVSTWNTKEWFNYNGESYANDKWTGFLPFLDLPQHTSQPLELALCLADDQQDDRRGLEQRGWQVTHSFAVASTPAAYQRYIQNSRGEFSCSKPSCVRLQSGWVSDRTLCYLASGKPAVVQHTGPRKCLPDAAGMFRFRDMDEAVRCLETVAADYDRQCRLARALAEEHFDARKIAAQVLEQALR